MSLIQRTELSNGAGGPIGEARHDLWAMVEVEGVALPARFEIDFPGAEDQPGLLIEAELVEGAMSCRKVTLTAKPGGKPVTGSTLREVRLESWVSQVANLLAMPVDVNPDGEGKRGSWSGDGPTTAVRRTIDSVMPKHGRQRLGVEHYQQVARHLRDSGGAVKGVADAMGVPFSTAARWVREARRRGIAGEARA